MVLASLLPIHTASAQGFSFIRDTEIENLLNDYARPIFRAAGLGSQRIKVRIVRQSSFNAFVLDGHNVFINTGTLIKSETPNQVIGVFAHETGHITGGHLAGMRAKIKRDATRNLLMKILGIGAIIGGATAGGDAKDIAGGLGKSILYGSDTVSLLSLLSYRRAQESSADQAGVSFLNATRQSAYGMLETFEYFARQEYFSGRFKDPYVRSHPAPQSRIAQLRRLAESSPYFSKKDPPQLQLRHDLMRAKLAGYLNESNPGVVFNAYPESDQSLPARYARAIAYFFQGGIRAAKPRIDALIREYPKSPYFREVRADFLSRSGRVADSITDLKKAISLMKINRAGHFSIRLAAAMFATNAKRYSGEMIKILKTAIRKNALDDDENADAYRLLANAYGATGKTMEANFYTAKKNLAQGRLKIARKFALRAKRQIGPLTTKWFKRGINDIIHFSEQTN